MQELMIDQLRDLYDAEKQLTKALPKLAKSANDEELVQGFREHLEQTKGHAQRLEQIFEQLGMRAKSKPCEAMKGLVKEGQEAIEEEFEEPVGDIALIAAARRVEHYEMAAYETLLLACQASKQTQVAALLQQTLKEENETDKRLVTIARRLLKDASKPPRPVADEKAISSGPSAKKAAPSASKPDASAKSGPSAVKKTGGSSRSSKTDSSSQTTTEHDEIRKWAEERGGKPACVRGTGGKGDIGLMRIEFPGSPNANDDKLEEISWEDFFEKFDERGLALVYQAKTASGQKSNFNKLITKESPASKTRTAS